MRNIGIGLIGTGFMGHAHALAFQHALSSFTLPVLPRLVALADADPARAARCAADWGFAKSCDWESLIADPQVELVAITTPNLLHAPMALAALAAGKAVYCEKPLAVTLEEATQMRDAARAAGVVNRVGYNYLQNPMLGLARDLIAAGEVGEIVSFNGEFSEDFMGDPQGAFTWRCETGQAGGALADLGSHLLSLSRFLLGPVEALCADLHTAHGQRPHQSGLRAVEVDDQAHLLLRFASGARGALTTSWLKHGRKNRLAFEVCGTRGTLTFDQERLNELRFYQAGERPELAGFRTLLAGPQLPDYAAFCPAPGHQLGYNELKTLEVRSLLEALGGNSGYTGVDFQEAWEVERLAHAARTSSREGRWVRL
ncbi:1-carboxy-3-chloro-3,4-dihydroxycyclo hexa-1,5-diene dehydrogenase [Pseudomonas sp. 8Z]|uniref:Gfo/Idh/MocA family protein n=1 Tax=Pseudomonas sp. 8Z TaxID=2653166 RepID=UPI0012F32253|nr:Gfo/Idh/MocA family oxidoreductase [Pseudomonas sp. 8Z]VXC30911.1 1-carboxy-3-chloro-3,4-dihydroxycyclo hexa-1,5-diene dehydrogenase [Pseudomonas sp. 8Z]